MGTRAILRRVDKLRATTVAPALVRRARAGPTAGRNSRERNETEHFTVGLKMLWNLSPVGGMPRAGAAITGRIYKYPKPTMGP